MHLRKAEQTGNPARGVSFAAPSAVQVPGLKLGDAVFCRLFLWSVSRKRCGYLNLRFMQANMAGAGGKSMGSYDYLIKLMLIGDSGKKFIVLNEVKISGRSKAPLLL